MLGKLFSNLPTPLTSRKNSPDLYEPSSSRRGSAGRPLDSVQEDLHTRNLLFPDAELLWASQHEQVSLMSNAATAGLVNSGGYDVDTELGIAEGKDVRVLVMQEASSWGSATLMLDSHAVAVSDSPILGATPPHPTHNLRSARGSISSQRRTSLGLNATSKPVVITQDFGAQRGFGGGSAFDRRPSHGHMRQNSIHESDSQRSSREYREEISIIANCMFGASDVMAYKGTGSKMHILQPEPRAHSHPTSSVIDDGRSSLGRSFRRSGLSQSFTSESVRTDTTGGTARREERKRVLVTRIFPVTLPNDEPDSPIGQTDGNSYPFPSADQGSKSEKLTPKQKRTPMYAIGLIIQLPPSQAAAQHPSPPSYRAHQPGSFVDDSTSSSFSSLKPSWSVVRSNSTHSTYGIDSLESSYSCDVDSRIDVVTQHWDIIIRTLDTLQETVGAKLLQLLKQADISSPDPLQLAISGGKAPHHHRSASVSIAGKRVKDEPKEGKEKKIKMLRTNVKTVSLQLYALANDATIKLAVEKARRRVQGGITTLQVITRQGRWGIWRDEARWVARWAGSKEQGFFFYNLLTAFMSTHTEWLEALAPTSYRKKFYKRQRALGGAGWEDKHGVRARTVILSNNKMATRRLIFLLSAFLPSNHQGAYRGRVTAPPSIHGGSFKSDGGGYSQSPPSYMAAAQAANLRESALRRRAQKSLHPGQAGSRHMSFPAQPKPNLNLAVRTATSGEGPDSRSSSRRASDAHASPIMPSLPMQASALSIQSNLSNASVTTSTSEAQTTVPHFSTAARRPICGTGPAPRPGSSGSLAHDDLVRRLERGSSNASSRRTANYASNNSRLGNERFDHQAHDDAGGMKWGSMLGSLWRGNRERKASDAAKGIIREDELGPRDKDVRIRLVDDVQKANDLGTVSPAPLAESCNHSAHSGNSSSGKDEKRNVEPCSEPKACPQNASPHPEPAPTNTPPTNHPLGAYVSPIKTSILADGTINVDVPLPTFLSHHLDVAKRSIPSSVSSSGILSSIGILEGEAIDNFEHYNSNGESGLNVAGWISRWHEDFVLAGVPADITKVVELEDDVKLAMRSEPTPAVHFHRRRHEGSEVEEKWVDVATTVIANTTNWTIKRITLRRLVRPASSTTHPTLQRQGSGSDNDNIALPVPTLHDHKPKPEMVVGSFDSGRASIYGNPYSDALPPPRSSSHGLGISHGHGHAPALHHTSTGFSSHLEGDEKVEVVREEWREEMCIAFDPTLIDAVERVIDYGTDPSPSTVEPHSYAPVPTVQKDTPIKTVVPAPTPEASQPRPTSICGKGRGEVSRGEVKGVILGALEDIARDVSEELRRAERNDAGDELSILQEEVREWMRDLSGR